jgi:signal transduction histidine kinase
VADGNDTRDPGKAQALVELAARYASLGLDRAADAALERAARLDPAADRASRARALLALGHGDGSKAKAAAEEALRRRPSVGNRLLLARAAHAAGELAAARFAYAAAVAAADATTADRAAAYAGRAEVALAEGDQRGAVAQILGAVSEKPREPELCERVARAAAAAHASAEALERVDERIAENPADAAAYLLKADLLAAAQTRSEADVGTGAQSSEADDRVEAALDEALARAPDLHAARLRLAARLVRRRYRDPAARARALGLLDQLEHDLAGGDPLLAPVDLARVALLRGVLDDGEGGDAALAAEAYERALGLRPAEAQAATRLGALALLRGDHDACRVYLLRAIEADPAGDAAYHLLARSLVAERGLAGMADEAVAMLGGSTGVGASAGTGAPLPERASRLLAAAAQTAREVTFEGLFTKGHQLKNVIGVVGARLRGVGRDLVDTRLQDVTQTVAGLYDDWAAFLRTLKEDEPRLEVVGLNAVCADLCAEAAQAGRQVVLRAADPLPDVRGDRPRLREALRNVLQNALEAQGEGAAPAELRTRILPPATGAAPRVAIEVVDHGPGIAPADLKRIFAPGFTTKASGSGFGLTIAERVVTAHHGRIEIESEPGQGTTVRFILPVDIGAADRSVPRAGGPL